MSLTSRIALGAAERSLRPLLVDRRRALDLVASLERRPAARPSMPSCGAVEASILPMRDGADPAESGAVRVIDIRGGLAARGGWWAGGYDEIADEVTEAAADAAVEAILLRIDSPGGEAANIEVAAEAIRAAAQAKPLWALADTEAYSAAYWLASQAGRLLVAPKGGVGSIGVIMLHVDYSAALKRQGVQIDEIVFGERKTEFAPWKKLSDEARAWAQASVDELGEEFIGTVARGRRLDRERVRETQARLLTAAEAVEMGFADEAMSFADAVAAIRDEAAARRATRSASGSRSRTASADGTDTSPAGGSGEQRQEDTTMPNKQDSAADNRPADAFAGGAPELPAQQGAAGNSGAAPAPAANAPAVDMTQLVGQMAACGINDMALAADLGGRCASTEAAVETAQLVAMAGDEARRAIKAQGAGRLNPATIRAAILNGRAAAADEKALDTRVQAHDGLEAGPAIDLLAAADRWNARNSRTEGV